MTLTSKNYSPFFLTLLLAIILTGWTSCREVAYMSGENTGGPADDGSVLRECYDGWTKNTATEACECLPPNVVVGQYECRTIEAEDWYSDMSGCLVDQGISFQMEGVVHPDSASTFTSKALIVEVPDTINSRKLIRYGFYRLLQREERFDSIQFYLPSTVPLPYYVHRSPGSAGYNTGFHGVILNDSTLVGQFVFGPMYDEWELNPNLIFSECEAIIRKGRIE